MPTPEEIEAAAGVQPPNEVERKRFWAAAQALAAPDGRAPSAQDLATAERVLSAARAAEAEHLESGKGRATITISDGRGQDEVDVAVEFNPQLQEISAEEVGGTPAQLLALEFLNAQFGDGSGGDEAGHGHSHDGTEGHGHSHD